MHPVFRATAALVPLCMTPTAAAQQIYFPTNAVGSDQIWRVQQDGSWTWIVTGLDQPRRVAIDRARGKLYWTLFDRIQRANLNGTQVETFASGLVSATALEVDPLNDHLYWSTGAGGIRRANLDGSNPVQVVAAPNAVSQLAVDAAAGRLFWCSSLIYSADLDGTNRQVLPIPQGVVGIALDPIAQRLYWTAAGSVHSARYDGSDQQTVLSGSPSSPVWSIEIDPSAGTMYLAAFEEIRRANLDGTDLVTILGGGAGGIVGSVTDVALDGSTALGTPLCLGDGSAAACPCGNPGATGAGCANGSSPGARLAATGWASVGYDTVAFEVTGVPPGETGILFQGDLALGGGAGLPFGDGLLCAGGTVFRLETLVADGAGVAGSTAPVAERGGAAPGDTLRYQLWYRDVAGSPCGAQFNLSQGLELAWGS